MFDAYEVRMRELVRKSDTPVLGLLGTLVPSEAREAIRKDLSVFPSARAFTQRIDQYPALFGVWLAEHVMLGLGQDGHFSLYPHLQKAVGGVPELTQPDRELLWRAFRRAMLKLGIQPLSRRSGTHFMADEYIRQAGVPIAFADDLAGRMLQVARRIGLPDEDDQEGLLTWQTTLLNKLAPPFSVTAKKAVERDAVAYYARAFVRVYLNGGLASNQDPLETAFSKAFSKEGSRNVKRTAIPELMYRDGTLGILFPPSTTTSNYRVQAGEFTQSVRVDTHGTYRPIPTALPASVVVQREDGERVLSVKLWPDSLSNRLLIFNAEGRLRASAQLNQDEPVELPPGNYIALCRFEPSNTNEWVEVNERPLLVEALLEVRPGSEQLLENGPASVSIIGQNQPTFSLKGSVKGSLERLEFWYGELSAMVEVPQEWLQVDISAFEVRVVHGEQRVAVPVSLNESGRASAPLGAAIAALRIQPGMRRLVFELARTGEARVLRRQSVLYWADLCEITYGLRFAYNKPPQNLITSYCAGLKVTPTQVTPTDDHSRVLRMAFDLGGGRLIHLSWHRPGVFVEIQVPNNDGSSTVLSRPLGAAETVSLTSAKTVVVSASEPGYITLGSMRTFVDFTQRPSKSFPASFLASRLEPGGRTLTYESQSGNVSLPLLVLSQPHVATDVKTERLGNLLIVRIKVSGEPTDISVTGRELSSGREARAEHGLMAGTWHNNNLARMQVYSAPTGSSHVVHILIDVETLGPGVWLLGFGACIAGIWGRLQDTDEGRIAVAFAVDQFGKELLGKDIVAAAETLELTEVAARLSRLTEHFSQYWSPVCWEQQSWLMPYFSALVDRLRDQEDDYVTELVEMAMTLPPDDVRPGYMSMQSVPACLNRIFALPRGSYKRVNIKAHSLSIALRAMPELRGAVSHAFGTVLHPTAAMPFKNLAEVMHGRRPKGFQLSTYREALQQTTLDCAYQLDDELFLPKEGDLLGPLHLAHAWRDLERRFVTCQLMPSRRKSAAVALARALQRHETAFDQAVPAGLRGQSLLLWLRRPTANELDEGEQLKLEHMEYIAQACAWLAWYCRLEMRSEGALNTFHAKLVTLRNQVEIPGMQVSDCLAYYLQVAPAMFSFYLLLWELVLTVELDASVQNV